MADEPGHVAEASATAETADRTGGASGGGVEAEPGTGTRTGGSRRRVLPLNSRRLTAGLLRQLAGGLGVPASASQGDLLTLIEGKLEEASHDPLHTQVVLREVEGGTHISLQDETGVFEEIDPPN